MARIDPLPDSIDAAFARAAELHAQGRDDEAKRAYLAVLALDGTHLGTLVNLGTLLFNTGYRTAARTAYRQAVRHHPADTTARVNYANALYANGDLFQAREEYEAALRVDADCPRAHQGLAYVYDRFGDERAAERHRERGYRGNAATLVPYRGTGRAVPVLLLVSALGGNVDTDRFLDDRRYSTTKLFAEYADEKAPVPFHAFVFNAVGDADLCERALRAAGQIVARTNAPVINEPEAVLATSRVENARRFARIENVVAPKTQRFSRERLAGGGGVSTLERAGFAFPLLLRTPGFHTGEHFVRVERPDELHDAVASLPGRQLTAIEFLDARGADGRTRKYRAMIVAGKLYPLHLAIADNWKLHYFTAQTHACAEHRREEAAFLDAMPAVLGAKAMAALERIAAELALDYAGIDFGIDPHGRVLFFEANATMLVPPAPADYRGPAAARVATAVATMLEAAATATLPRTWRGPADTA